MEKKCCKITTENHMPNIDPFPRSEFDDWAESYDLSVTSDRFPFIGYRNLLDSMVTLAGIKPGQSVLDLGTGTGNLAFLLDALGANMWCTDFSAVMLEKARKKLPGAHFLLNDLRARWPIELNHPFDRIVSAYVFHHFELDQKVRILCNLIPFLAPNGRMIIGDISFPDTSELERVKIAEGDAWEDEFYWLADLVLPALENCGFKVEYTQVSLCAGIYTLQP
jgi:putative AdoMet-dependent methyltransferase